MTFQEWLKWTTSAMIFVALSPAICAADGPVIPHNQTAPPNDPYTTSEAVARMKVPDGFRVEVVASEPDIVNPVAMTFDEKGRVWITESLEYPRRSPGVGRDRVKVLEDTDGDGKADKFTVFAEGLNIPSGVAVGHGGVWVANAPDILFFQDTDGDGKADRREVVVTGFGRDDTHELPNTLAWGPDGWLYGWNGVFNPSRIDHRGKTYHFTCAIFRIHPKTREFEVFCEGTSNPWGIAWDDEGSAFSSACVIDHLWHLVETGYYHRQGGPYPPFTWKLGSIVDHLHQKAAYCGVHYYDSDVYPAAYRGKLFFGNIHGNGINVDRLARKGSTYAASPEPDFLTANDVWFMPVSQKTGPDGCLYILDWYDRYHCYQDANRDPEGIDRLKGRLYRVRYKDVPRRTGFDLAKLDEKALVELLGSGNSYDRETARRLIHESPLATLDSRLRQTMFEGALPRPTRMNALWAAVARGSLDAKTTLELLAHPDPGFRAWAIRATGNVRKIESTVRDRIMEMYRDEHPDVRLQAAVAARKIEGLDAVRLLSNILDTSYDDPVIPHVVWQNIQPLLDDPKTAEQLASRFTIDRLKGSTRLREMARLTVERLMAGPRASEAPVARLVRALLESEGYDPRGAGILALRGVAARFQSGQLAPDAAKSFQQQLAPVRDRLAAPDQPVSLRWEALLLSAAWGDSEQTAAVRDAFSTGNYQEKLSVDDRIRALNTLISAKDGNLLESCLALLSPESRESTAFKGQLIENLGKLEEDRVGIEFLKRYAEVEPALQGRVIELLTQRPSWGRLLLNAIGEGKIPTGALNVNQVRKLLASRDPELAKLVKARWGTLRETRNPQREQTIVQMRTMLTRTPGDARAGAEVFKKLCAQCHKIHGEGQDVGPDVTANGRASLDQLLSNVFDPSLVIGTAYQGTTVATTDGRILTGLLAEDSPQRVVLKLQGGKLETIPRSEVEAVKTSELSLMPEDVEKQLKSQEIADLFAYITLDRSPSDPAARPIPGAENLPRTRPKD